MASQEVLNFMGKMPIRMNSMSMLGIALIVMAVVPWGWWTLRDSTRTWFFAKDVPISLSNGSHYSSGVVKTNMTALYSVYISANIQKGADAGPLIESDKSLACQIGINDPKVDPCPNPPEWKFQWTLSSSADVIKGNSDDTIGQGRIDSAARIDREIGEFRTEAGQRYKFDLDVMFDNRDARIVNPRLMVAVSDFQTGSSMFVSGLLKLICLPIAAIGTVMILGSPLSQWWKRRQANNQEGLAKT